jgi:hypothetical protein
MMQGHHVMASFALIAMFAPEIAILREMPLDKKIKGFVRRHKYTAWYEKGYKNFEKSRKAGDTADVAEHAEQALTPPYQRASVLLLTSNTSSFNPFICGILYRYSVSPPVLGRSNIQTLWRELSCLPSSSSGSHLLALHILTQT